jgi:hypothetical protein
MSQTTKLIERRSGESAAARCRQRDRISSQGGTIMQRIIMSAIALSCIAAAAQAAESTTLHPQQYAALIDAARPALVRVEYTLRYDKGDEPEAAGWSERCPNCGQFHSGFYGSQLVRDKRPYEASGFLLSPTQVLTQDGRIHPRFIERIRVRVGEQLIDATSAALCLRENAVILELAEPVRSVGPLEFQPDRPEPYYTVSYAQTNAVWTISAAALPSQVTVTSDGRQFRSVPDGCLIVDASGVPVGASFFGELAADESWKGSPLDWPAYSAAEMRELVSRIESVVSAGLLHVTLKFRSPKQSASPARSYWYDDDEGEDSELHEVGVLYEAQNLLVLAELSAKQTARLEKIIVNLPDKRNVEARFGASLREFGCFTAELDELVAQPVAIDEQPITALRDELAVSATVEFFGNVPVVRLLHERVPAFTIGYERKVYPVATGDDDHLFVFRVKGALAALPVTRRDPLHDEDEWSDGDPELTPATYVAAHLADLEKFADPNNLPLNEDAENRVAWLGVELQALDHDLAMINEISEITRNGEFGAIVSYLYADSPAAEAGAQVGDILLQLHVPDYHKPVPVAVDEGNEWGAMFPWDRLDEVPEEYLSQIPSPWPAVQNDFTEKITGIGMGKTFELEFSRGGSLQRVSLAVTESPPHFESAARFKVEELGLTVRNLTYEVRRFFQLAPHDPGVIISKIEPGSKAYVSGLRPYEIVTGIDEEPVTDVAAFAASLASGRTELRLDVKRMTRTRVVKLNLDGPTATADSGDAQDGVVSDDPAQEKTDVSAEDVGMTNDE